MGNGEGPSPEHIDTGAHLNTTNIDKALSRYDMDQAKEEDIQTSSVEERASFMFGKILESLKTFQSQEPSAVLTREIQFAGLAEQMIVVEGGFLTNDEVSTAMELLGITNEVGVFDYDKEVNRLKQQAQRLIQDVGGMNIVDSIGLTEESRSNKEYLIEKAKELALARQEIETITRDMRKVIAQTSTEELQHAA